MAMKRDFGIPVGLQMAAASVLNPSLTTLLRPPPSDPVVARRPHDPRRLNIWEVRGASLCSIIGTCLTLSELRRIAKKCRFCDDPYQLTDYDIHGMITSQMNTDNAASRAVTKHLNAKFEGALRKSRGLEDEAAFLQYWEGAVEAGLAPGAYWALVGHPGLPMSVEARVYGDIHMMSHMCGASNRGDARTIAEAQREKGEIARRLGERIAERDQRLSALEAERAALRAKLRALEELAVECQQLRETLARDGLASELALRVDELSVVRSENAGLRRRLASAELRLEQMRARQEAQKEAQKEAGQAARERQRKQGLQEMPSGYAVCPENPAEDGEALAADLCGRCLLYVGGRPQTICQLRHLVMRRNGRLLHHDGGVEQSQARLGELVRQADEVFFPVDCVSHGAMDFVKKLCESQGKPMVPLRTASITTFMRAIGTFGPGEAAP
ncbi:DUF2325 domain-containing protein [Rhodoblastus sp.]|jgi:regulator of replication initiation timing|uniref:DUF2325 domain-containing protein n=1 Tax=Rhodoblastus sp. TaxID=1962975 RepID=UPI0025E35748|nr:DUF2325 domain-containing protein [Rhodoblastus sp.]